MNYKNDKIRAYISTKTFGEKIKKEDQKDNVRLVGV